MLVVSQIFFTSRTAPYISIDSCQNSKPPLFIQEILDILVLIQHIWLFSFHFYFATKRYLYKKAHHLAHAVNLHLLVILMSY